MLTNYGLDIPDSEWEQCGTDEADTSARLLAGIHINGLSMHLEAWAVEAVNGEQRATDPALDSGLGLLIEMMGTTFQTIEIMGREYALFATPYGR